MKKDTKKDTKDKRKFNTKYRLMIVMLLVMLTMAMLTACGNSEDSSSDQSGQDNATAADNQSEKEFAEKMIMPKDLGTTTDLNKFATIDIYGNAVSNEILGGYEYTIIDVWGTYCNPCIKAMPDMKKVYDEYKDKGVNVMGIVIDVQDADRTPQFENILNARKIVETQEADFTHMLVPKNLLYSFLSDVQVIPTQFIVDNEGNIISEYYKGGNTYDQWCEILDEKLKDK